MNSHRAPAIIINEQFHNVIGALRLREKQVRFSFIRLLSLLLCIFTCFCRLRQSNDDKIIIAFLMREPAHLPFFSPFILVYFFIFVFTMNVSAILYKYNN